MQNHAVEGWLDLGEERWRSTVGFGPAGFEAYARLRVVPDPLWPGQCETEPASADEAMPESEQVELLLHVLLAQSPPQEVHVAVWDGWGEDLSALPGVDEGWLAGVARRYRVRRQPRDELLEHGFGDLTPAFVWPQDRSWCFAFDVDPHWAGIGGSRESVTAALAIPGLDVVEADRDAEQPHHL